MAVPSLEMLRARLDVQLDPVTDVVMGSSVCGREAGTR